MEKTSVISVSSTVLFERLNVILAQQQEISLPGNLKILSMKMRGDDTWLYVVAEVKGPYNGTVIIQSKPSFDTDGKRIKINELNIEIGEDSMFAKFASKMANSFLAEKVDNKLEETVNEKFTALVTDILNQLKDVALPKGGSLKFDISSYTLSDLRTDTTGLHFVAELTGTVRMNY